MLELYEKEQYISCCILKRTIESNKYSHAYLIETNNYDKSFNFVLSFVKEIFCNENSNEYSNNQICTMVENNEFPELSIINPDGQWIKKEQLLDLQEEFNKKSIVGNKKIYIINNADRLNTIAANSILKFLEEPQEGIIAILICDNRYKILNTILSRCQIITLNGQAFLNNNNDSYLKINKLLNIDNEEKSKEKLENVINFIKYYENNRKKALLYIDKYWNIYFNSREEIYNGLVIMLLFYKDMLNFKLNRPLKIFQNEIEIEKNSTKNSINMLLKKIDIINKSIQKIEYNVNLNLLIDKLIIEMDDVYGS